MMKQFIGLVIAIMFAHTVAGAPMVNFKISKSLCLLTFLEAAAGEAHSSSTLRKYISDHLPKEDSADFRAVINTFSALDIENTYTLQHYPKQRQKPRSSANLIKMAAVQADDLPDFFRRISGILPNEQLLMLKDVLTKASYFYDEMILKEHKAGLEKQLTALKLYNEKTKEAFVKLKTFYGSTWPENMPFTVAIYPVPGNTGNTTATPHNNSLVLAVLTEETDHDSRIGVAMHEICHVLYEEQPLALQWKLDSAFLVNPSISKEYAYSYIDEALATACGNGWMYEYLTGKLDKGSWYNDDYINAYAQALYPMVKSYVDNFKTIDRRFITSAISIFEKQFPDAAYEYSNIFNRMSFYTDAKDNEQYRSIMNTLNRYYKVYSSNSSYPITDPQSLELADRSEGTQLFIVHTKHKENFTALQQIFPELSKADEGQEGIVSFIDKHGRPVVLINVKEVWRIDAAFRKMREMKKISQGLSFLSINQ